MRSDVKDLTGERFGMLVAKSIAGSKPTKWLCECDCGNLHITEGRILRDGRCKSGGCNTSQLIIDAQTKYEDTELYSTWSGMKSRCNNPKNKAYVNYGGRGIKVCAEWENDFQQFVDDMGERPEGYSIDRKENDGDYSANNCRWATKQEQVNNTRRNRNYTFNDKTQNIGQWAKELGIEYKTMQQRFRTMTAERALSTSGKLSKQVFIKHNGLTMNYDGWAKELGLSVSGLKKRLAKLTVEQALNKDYEKDMSYCSEGVIQLTKQGVEIQRFPSGGNAAKILGLSSGNISAVCNGVRMSRVASYSEKFSVIYWIQLIKEFKC